MRESMAKLTPRFSTNRTVREYADDTTFRRQPAAVNGLPIRALGRQVVDWQHAMDQKWARCTSADCGLKPMRATTRLRSSSF